MRYLRQEFTEPIVLSISRQVSLQSCHVQSFPWPKEKQHEWFQYCHTLSLASCYRWGVKELVTLFYFYSFYLSYFYTVVTRKPLRLFIEQRCVPSSFGVDSNADAGHFCACKQAMWFLVKCLSQEHSNANPCGIKSRRNPWCALIKRVPNRKWVCQLLQIVR